MVPSTTEITLQLRHLIYYHLDNSFMSNALFLAERLHAVDPRNQDAIHLLAFCHFRSGQIGTAYEYSRAPARRNFHLGCAYVFAQASLYLHRPAEGIDVLERTRSLWSDINHWVNQTSEKDRFLPDAPAILCLLGKLYEADKRTETAIECYAEALKLNPFMWDAFERLCDTGTNIRTANIFKLKPELQMYLSSRQDYSKPTSHLDTSFGTQKSAFHQSQNVTRSLASVETDPFAPNVGAHPGNNAVNATQHSVRTNQPKGLATGVTNHNVNASNMRSLETPPATLPSSSAQPRLPELARGAHHADAPNAPTRKHRLGHIPSVEINMDPSQPRHLSTRGRKPPVSEEIEQTGVTATQPPTQHKRTISGSVSVTSDNNDINIRRSRRLFSQIRPNSAKPVPVASAHSEKDIAEPKKAKATGTKGRPVTTASTVGRVISGNRKLVAPDQREAASRENRAQASKPDHRLVPEKRNVSEEIRLGELEAIQWILDILGKIGQGCYLLSQYRCKIAVDKFRSIPQAQRDTPWILSRIGKALYEQNEYAEAGKIFARVRKMMPSSVVDMEVYSTVLWHLKNDTELAFLSHELLDTQRLSPEAWCTIGNLFSLQREHDQALKCFRRATQLSPKFAYGYTLQGHEHMANEEFDKALSSYRRAISADRRHYNGWYGLGKVYEKLGDYAMAEKHYRTAASINPTNAVLYCCIGHVLEKLKQPQAALEQYQRASNLQPTGSNSLYRTARVLLNLRRNQDALRALIALKGLAPDESNVHFMLARAYARIRNKSLAIKHYTIAMNLDPKAAPYLKEQMEGLDDEDDDDDYECDDEDEEMT